MKTEPLTAESFDFDCFSPQRTRNVDCPLEQLSAAAASIDSALWERSVTRLGPLSRSLASNLSKGGVRVDHGLWLPGGADDPEKCACAEAVRKVLEFAILSRVDQNVQNERLKSGLRPSYINGTGMDLLKALQMAWESGDIDRLFGWIRNEARCYLDFVPERGQLDWAIWRYMGEFQTIAQEAAAAEN
jgi:hypothetical protein